VSTQDEEEAKRAQARTLEILPRVLEGDGAAFDELFALHDPFLRSLARRLLHLPRRHTMLDDVSQTVWIRIVEKKAVYTEDKAFRSWILAVTANVCMDMKRGAARAAGGADPDEVGSESLAPERRDLETDVHAALASLPGRGREILVLYFFEKLTFVEIAARLDMSKSAVARDFDEAKKLIGPRLAAWARRPPE
jgi:RNA polymerase sigma-70 factor (ECF subfamily)